MSNPSLTFLGATGTVTGSRFLVEAAGAVVLVDAGLYQGSRELRRRNWDDFPVNPAVIDARRPHPRTPRPLWLPAEAGPGRIPWTDRLHSRNGSAGRESSSGTVRTSRRRTRPTRTRRGYSKHRPALPLYDTADVIEALPLFDPVDYDQSVSCTPRITARLLPAGHILGSATVHLDVDGAQLHVSGDLGRPFHPLLRPPADPLAGKRARGGVDVRRPDSPGSRRHGARPTRCAAPSGAVARC